MGLAAGSAALCRGYQAMLGQRTPGRVAAQAAQVTVEDIALFTHDGGFLGCRSRRAGIWGSRFALLVAVNYPFRTRFLGKPRAPGRPR